MTQVLGGRKGMQACMSSMYPKCRPNSGVLSCGGACAPMLEGCFVSSQPHASPHTNTHLNKSFNLAAGPKILFFHGTSEEKSASEEHNSLQNQLPFS